MLIRVKQILLFICHIKRINKNKTTCAFICSNMTSFLASILFSQYIAVFQWLFEFSSYDCKISSSLLIAKYMFYVQKNINHLYQIKLHLFCGIEPNSKLKFAISSSLIVKACVLSFNDLKNISKIIITIELTTLTYKFSIRW